MKINVSEFLYAFSVALDVVEGDLLGATTFHSQRVAYICALMAKQLGLSELDATRLAICATLHDNALTEYIKDEVGDDGNLKDVDVESTLGKHCVIGEKNIENFPFYESIKGAILYHHERGDGNGPFGKTPEETPMFARLIHLGDRVDMHFKLGEINPGKYEEVRQFVKDEVGRSFDAAVAELFLEAVSYRDLEHIAAGKNTTEELFKLLPSFEREYTGEEMVSFAGLFAKIIDMKSPFTTRHSRGIAEKARDLGRYFGWDKDTCDKLYLAGALHDVGKLMVSNALLEKPGRLTSEEFAEIKNHAIGSYVVLNSIKGFEEITSWACLHHEKLDGSGYPFGYTGDKLGEKERLMACIDIYQALVEPRPYKDGMPHEKAMEILWSEVNKNHIDKSITQAIDDCYKKGGFCD